MKEKDERSTPAAEPASDTPKRPRWVQVRLFPILVRVALVVLLTGVSLALGLMVGYGIIGDGSPQDVFKRETWTHILDIVTEQ